MAREKYEAIKEAKDVVKTPAEISQMFSDLAASLHLAEEVLVLPQLPRVQNIYAAERRVSEGEGRGRDGTGRGEGEGRGGRDRTGEKGL